MEKRGALINLYFAVESWIHAKANTDTINTLGLNTFLINKYVYLFMFYVFECERAKFHKRFSPIEIFKKNRIASSSLRLHINHTLAFLEHIISM